MYSTINLVQFKPSVEVTVRVLLQAAKPAAEVTARLYEYDLFSIAS